MKYTKQQTEQLKRRGLNAYASNCRFIPEIIIKDGFYIIESKINYSNKIITFVNMIEISEIKKRLDNCIDLYTDLFCQKQEVYADGWIGQIKGGINCFSDAFLSFEDIRTDLELNAPKGKIFKWYWENIESKHNINYNSYLKGLRVKDLK